MDVIHTAIWVSDIDDAIQFFVDELGLQENWRFVDGCTTNVYVGGENGEIQLRHRPGHEEPNPDRSDLDHVAVSVDDVDEVFERMVQETEAEVIEEPRSVEAADARVSFITGPDGYTVELVEDLG